MNSMKIGPIDYKLTYKKQVRPKGEKDNRYWLGLTNLRKKCIEISDQEVEQSKVVTELHEAIHAMLYEYELQGTLKGPDEEEVLVKHFTVALMALLRDNPKFTKRLINAL